MASLTSTPSSLSVSLHRLWHRVGGGCHRGTVSLSESRRVNQVVFGGLATIISLGLTSGLLAFLHVSFAGIIASLAITLSIIYCGAGLFYMWCFAIGMVYDGRMYKQRQEIHQSMLDMEGLGETSYYPFALTDRTKRVIEQWVVLPYNLLRKVQFIYSGFTPESAASEESTKMTVADMQVNAALNNLPFAKEPVLTLPGK